MNWFNLRDLENRLAENKVTDREGFNYLLANFILFSLASYASGNEYHSQTFFYVEMMLVLLFTVAGLKLTYGINRNGDGADYLKRFLSLYFVIGIRIIVFIFVAALLAAVLTIAVYSDEPLSQFAEDAVFFSLMILVNVLFYYWLIRSFKRIARQHA